MTVVGIRSGEGGNSVLELYFFIYLHHYKPFKFCICHEEYTY